MIIQTVKGDIRNADRGFIVSGCNAQNKNGSGLARSLAEKWPVVKQDYHDVYYRDQFFQLGSIHPVKVEDNLTVINLISQEYYGYDGDVYVSYSAIEVGFTNIVRLIRKLNQLDPSIPKIIHIPKIGCGLAGGNWDKVKGILKSIPADDFEVYYWEYESD